MVQYHILLHEISYKKASSYLVALKSDETKPGKRLAEHLKDSDILLPAITGYPEGLARQNWDKKTKDDRVKDFLQRLVRTKKPQIFAESQVVGDGSDWNLDELSILGDIAIAVPVKVYDNGLHHDPRVHDRPFAATLLFVPGALLRNDRGGPPADLAEVTLESGEFDYGGYYELYERRLLPCLKFANDAAASYHQQALITIPGLGCGQFAGKFQGELEEELKKVLIKLLEEYGRQLPNVKAVYYDPYMKCRNARLQIGQISLLVRPLMKGNENKPQLCLPQTYAEEGDDFSDCQLFSFVAWDHVSWPGNDFYQGSRATDDGVKAAATNVMAAVTGIEGAYNPGSYQYEPPKRFGNWEDVVKENRAQLELKDNLSVLAIESSGRLSF